MNSQVSKPLAIAPSGNGAQRIESRSDAVKLVESLLQDAAHYHRKDYFLRYGLEALLNAMERKVF